LGHERRRLPRVGDLTVGEHALQEALAERRQRFGDAADAHEIDSNRRHARSSVSIPLCHAADISSNIAVASSARLALTARAALRMNALQVALILPNASAA